AAVDHLELVAAADPVDRGMADAKLLGDLPRRQALLGGLDHPGSVGVFEALDVPMIRTVRGLSPSLERLGVITTNSPGLLKMDLKPSTGSRLVVTRAFQVNDGVEHILALAGAPRCRATATSMVDEQDGAVRPPETKQPGLHSVPGLGVILAARINEG